MLCISGVANAIVFVLDKDMRSNLNSTKLLVRQSRILTLQKTAQLFITRNVNFQMYDRWVYLFLNNIGQRQILYDLLKTLTFNFA